jgi:hypothetical protein
MARGKFLYHKKIRSRRIASDSKRDQNKRESLLPLLGGQSHANIAPLPPKRRFFIPSQFIVAWKPSSGILCPPRCPSFNGTDRMCAQKSSSHFSRTLPSPSGFARFELRPGLLETVCLCCFSRIGAATTIDVLTIVENAHICPAAAKKKPSSGAG